MTAKELAQFVGRTGTYSIPQMPLKIAVRLKDARALFGRVEVLVTPMAGSGQKWADVQSVTLDKEIRRPLVDAE